MSENQVGKTIRKTDENQTNYTHAQSEYNSKFRQKSNAYAKSLCKSKFREKNTQLNFCVRGNLKKTFNKIKFRLLRKVNVFSVYVKRKFEKKTN